MLSINPDAASRKDVARLADELMEARRLLVEVLEGSDMTVPIGVFLAHGEER
jgi:hypothetical protein